MRPVRSWPLRAALRANPQHGAEIPAARGVESRLALFGGIDTRGRIFGEIDDHAVEFGGAPLVECALQGIAFGERPKVTSEPGDLLFEDPCRLGHDTRQCQSRRVGIEGSRPVDRLREREEPAVPLDLDPQLPAVLRERLGRGPVSPADHALQLGDQLRHPDALVEQHLELLPRTQRGDGDLGRSGVQIGVLPVRPTQADELLDDLQRCGVRHLSRLQWLRRRSPPAARSS